MNYRLDTAGPAQLLTHLQAADTAFAPPLSTRIDLADYALKLATHSRCIEAWIGDSLVGLVAMYANDAPQGGFITNVSVLPGHQGRGIAGEMLRRTVALATELQLPQLRLEVYADNTAALALYRRHGFQPEAPAPTGPTLFLHREL